MLEDMRWVACAADGCSLGDILNVDGSCEVQANSDVKQGISRIVLDNTTLDTPKLDGSIAILTVVDRAALRAQLDITALNLELDRESI